MKIISSEKGMTLVELSVAMLISSIVILGGYKAYQYTSKSTDRENKKALIQRDIMASIEKISKDIRMAGLGLPGNGIIVTLSNDSSDKIEMFTNSSNTKTTLSANAGYSDTKIFVADCSGAKAGSWVCLAAGGTGLDTVYRKISKVGNNSSTGADTIYLSTTVGIGTLTNTNTQVHFCTRTHYKITKLTGRAVLTKGRDNLDVNVGEHIDSLSLTPLNLAGSAINGTFENTRSVICVVGGYIGNGANKNFISESVKIAIRNN